jgi:hypothetical protein
VRFISTGVPRAVLPWKWSYRPRNDCGRKLMKPE